MAFDVQGARKAGYTEDEIAGYLAKETKFDLAGAKKAGYSTAEIVGHLSSAKPAPTATVLDKATGFLANLNRGLVVGDEIAGAIKGAGNAVGALGRGEGLAAVPGAFREGMASQRATEDRFQASNPRMAALGRGVGNAATLAVPAGPLSGVLANATRAGNAVRGATAAGLTGAASAALDRGSLGERGKAAGETARNPLVLGLGALGGAMLPAARRVRPEETDVQRAARVLKQRGKADPEAMVAAADEMRDVGVKPTAIDVIGERGRRVVRAVGVKSDDAGEALVQNARTRMADVKPAAMAQARGLSDDTRTATKLADDLEAVRQAEARANYGAFANEPVVVPDTVRDMLRDAPGRAIIARARADAIENQDWAAQVELDKLLAVTDGPLPRVSASTMDQLAIAARERGANFARTGRNYRAKGALQRRDEIDSTLEGVEALKPARDAYRAKSQAIEVARGDNASDPFSTDPADYGAWLKSLSPDAREANKVAMRQDILDRLGGQKANSLGGLDQIESSEYFRDNLRQAIGDEAADQFIGNIRARLRQTRNASFVSPNAGSRTAVLENDLGPATGALAAADVAQKTLRGDMIGVAKTAADWFRRLGVAEADATALARVATDPARVDELVAAVRGPGGAAKAKKMVQALDAAAANANSALEKELIRAASVRLSRAAGVSAGTDPRPTVEVTVPALGISGASYGRAGQ